MEALYKGFIFDLNDPTEVRDLTYQALLGLSDEEAIRRYWNEFSTDKDDSWVYLMDMLDDYLDDRDITALQVACREVIDFNNFFTIDSFFTVDPFDGLIRSSDTIDRLVCWSDDDYFLDFVWEEYIKKNPEFYEVKINK